MTNITKSKNLLLSKVQNDFIGLDTTYSIANIMYEEFREPMYAAPPLLKRMVLAGRHGKKSGRGFYTY